MNQEKNNSNDETETSENNNWVEYIDYEKHEYHYGPYSFTFEVSDPEDDPEFKNLTEEELKRIDEEAEYLVEFFNDDEEPEPLNKKFLHDENKTDFVIQTIEDASNCIKDRRHYYYPYTCRYLNSPMSKMELIFCTYNHQELSQLSCIKKIKDELLEKSKIGDFPFTKIFLDKYYDKC